MALLLLPTPVLPRLPLRLRPLVRKQPLRFTRTRVTSGMEDTGALHMDFPYLSPTHQDLMSDLLSSFDSHLLCLPPPSPFLFENSSASNKGSILIVHGTPPSPVDFVLSAWIHCELPNGVLDITTFFAFLRSTATDAPHILMEFIQSGPKNMVLIMDLLARKDLEQHADYYAHFYEETQLARLRQELDKCPQVSTYSSPYVRSQLSPTAVAVSIACGEEGEMDGMIRTHVGEAARELVRVWQERCVGEKRELEEEEIEVLRRKDVITKKKAIEMDLTANLPTLFGEDVTREVVEVASKGFGVW